MSDFPSNELQNAIKKWYTSKYQQLKNIDVGPSVIDLFCGAGGLSLGFVMAGYKVILGIDIWKEALTTYKKNHPNTIILSKDLRNLKGFEIKNILKSKNYEIPDIVIGGPPCQGFSYAGKRDPNDERNNLVWHFLRLAYELDVDFFVMENVSGMLTMKTPNGYPVPDKIVERAEEYGYFVNYKLLDAANFWVPQHRKRVIVLGSSRGKPKHLVPLTSKYLTVKDGIGDLPTPKPQEPQPYEKNPETPYQAIMRFGSKAIYNHIPTKHSPQMIQRIKNTPPGQSVYPKFKHSWYRLKWNEPAPVMKENHNAPAVHPDEPRIITPREVARLQSFPDDFHFYGTKSSILKQIGNAVPPFLAYFIAKHILKILGVKALTSEVFEIYFKQKRIIDFLIK